MKGSSQIAKRLCEFVTRLYGDEYGSRKRFADAIGVSAQQANDLLTGRSGVGPVTQKRLREIGCDIEWLMTGKKAGYARTQQKSARVNEPLIEFNAPGGVPPNVKKKMQKLAKRLSKLKGEEIDKIDKLLDIYLNEKD